MFRSHQRVRVSKFLRCRKIANRHTNIFQHKPGSRSYSEEAHFAIKEVQWVKRYCSWVGYHDRWPETAQNHRHLRRNEGWTSGWIEGCILHWSHIYGNTTVNLLLGMICYLYLHFVYYKKLVVFELSFPLSFYLRFYIFHTYILSSCCLLEWFYWLNAPFTVNLLSIE